MGGLRQGPLFHLVELPSYKYPGEASAICLCWCAFMGALSTRERWRVQALVPGINGRSRAKPGAVIPRKPFPLCTDRRKFVISIVREVRMRSTLWGLSKQITEW